MVFNNGALRAILPLIVITIWASFLLLVVVFNKKASPAQAPILTAIGLLVTGFFLATQLDLEIEAFGGMLVVDGFSIFINMLLIVGGLLTVALSYDYLKRMNLARGEYYVLMLFSISGMMLMASRSEERRVGKEWRSRG